MGRFVWLLPVFGIPVLVMIMMHTFSSYDSSLKEEQSKLYHDRDVLEREKDTLLTVMNTLRVEFNNDLKSLKNDIQSIKNTKECGALDMEVLKKKFEKAVELKSTKHLLPYLDRNRKTLEKVQKWIDDEVYYKSIFHYGLPENVKHLINEPVGSDPTYADVMSYIGNEYFPLSKTYLEIGVSVGKTIFQMANAFNRSDINAYELENINPTLETLFTDKKIIQQWDSEGSGNPRKEQPCSLVQYKYPSNENTLHYLTSDVFQESSWDRLQGKKFDMIFSDGLHSSDALRAEISRIIDLKLLNTKHWLIWYDDLDLGESMSKNVFYDIFLRLRGVYPFLTTDNLALVSVRGWLGTNEYRHTNGLISNLNVTRILEDLV